MKNILIGLLVMICAAASAQEVANFSGKIAGIGGQPLIGANVHVLNSNMGATTDQDGVFNIGNIPQGKYTIELTAIGYATERKVIMVGVDNNDVNFTMAEASTQLDAIVVTAEKTEADVQSIPASISALSSRQVQQYRLWNSQDITAIVPNLYAASPGDNRNVTSIRGITSTSYDPAVATYIDGVNQFGLDTYIAQLFDVERIEVLRGPQGTLYGRNAMGGVINIITKQPTNDTKGFVELTTGNYGQQRDGFGFKTPLVKNKLFFGLSGLYDRTDGFYTNTFNNTKFDKKHSFTGNYYLKYLATKKLTFTINVKHTNNRNNGAFTLASSVGEAFEHPFKVNQNATAKMTDNVFNGSFSINYAGSRINFSSQSSYQSNYRFYDKHLDGDFSPIDGVSIFNNYGTKWNTVKVATQEFKFSSPAAANSPFQWTAGTYLYYQKSPVKQATRFGADAKYVGVEDDSLFSQISTGTGKNMGLAIFGQTTYALSEKLSVTAGLRYDYEHKKLGVLGEYQHDPNPDPIFETRPDTTATVSYAALSPKLNVSYAITSENMIYGSYARGFRTGGLTQLGSDPSQPPLYSYKPEYSNNIEVGFKNTFLNNHINVNVTAFYIQVNDAQVPTLVLPAAVTITRNTGNLTSKGMELQLAAKPIRGLQVEYNAGINRATYNKLNVSQNGTEVDLEGKKQIFTPAGTSMLALQYDQPIGASRNFKVIARGEWMYLGDQYFDLNNTIKQSGYNIINTRFGISYKNIGLTFWGRNLADKKYIAYAYDFGATHLGNPKTYGVTLRVDF